jgi:hypothetical protein
VLGSLPDLGWFLIVLAVVLLVVGVLKMIWLVQGWQLKYKSRWSTEL